MTIARSLFRTAGAAAAVALGSATLNAQASNSNGRLITNHDLATVAAATVGAAVLSHWDVAIAKNFGDSVFHSHHLGYTSAAKRGSFVTETVLMISSGTVYAIAHHEKKYATADIAFHTGESVASAAMFIQVVRGALGRARPYVVDSAGATREGDPYDFEFMHGFTSFNYRSFPSMHAMASFAVASALAREMKERDTPNRDIFTPALYVGASMPALARMYLNEHWASDIAMGVFLAFSRARKSWDTATRIPTIASTASFSAIASMRR